MPPRDIPDESCIVHTKRSRNKPRAADEEHSLAPNTSNTNGERAMRSSTSQEPVDQTPTSSLTPATDPSILSTAVMEEPSMTTTAIPGQASTEYGEPSPAASIMPLDPDPNAVLQSDNGQENTANVHNYFATTWPREPPRQEYMAAFNPREQGQTANEEVYLIDEDVEPTQQIIAQLLSLRDGAADDVHEDADTVGTPEMDEEPDYSSEPELEVVEMIDIHRPALPAQPQRELLPQGPQEQRAQADLRAAAAKRRRAFAASAVEGSRSTAEASSPSTNTFQNVTALPYTSMPHPLALAGNQIVIPGHAANSIVPELDAVRAVLDGKLAGELEIAVTLKGLAYGSAYRDIRYCLLMESACETLGFRVGHRPDVPTEIGGVQVTQGDVIEYLGLGKGRTFWNRRSLQHLVVKARNEVERIPYDSRQGHQTETLEIAKHMLHPSLLSLPCAAGAASTASRISRPDFEARCSLAVGMQQKGK